MLTYNERVVAKVIYDTMEMYQENFSDVMLEDIVWQNDKELSLKTIKGVVGSLIKKGFVVADDVNGEYNVFRLTPDGFKELVGHVPEYMEEE